MKKKARKSKAVKSVKDLPAKTLSAKSARGVKGGFTSEEHGASASTKGGGSTGGVFFKVKIVDALITS